MPTQPELIASFEQVLQQLGLAPASCRESDDWWRFEVDGVSFQGGVHSFDVRVLATVCALASDVDIDAVYEALGNTDMVGLARLEEQDNYLYASAKVSHADASADAIAALIRDCVALAKSPAASSLRSEFREW